MEDVVVQSPIPEIDLEEIMEKIGKEVAKSTPVSDAPQRVAPVASRMQPREPGDLGLADHILWKYGMRYSRLINRVPLLRKMAEKQYLRIVSIPTYQDHAQSSSTGGELNLEFLLRNWYYNDFIHQLRKEGIKGRIKLFVLRYVGFFAWWQGQINQSVSHALADLNYRDKQNHRALTSIEVNLSQVIEGVREEVKELAKQVSDHERSLLNHERRLTLFLEGARGKARKGSDRD